jgi:glycosyltransferase involved in cell wall biosynthesis
MEMSAPERLEFGAETRVLVSAVIPTLNRPGLLAKAVASALEQSYPLLEVVVVIDGKDPATEEYLSGLGAEVGDSRLRVIRLVQNVGGSEARNIGVREARGEWIAFLDDDDEWLPGKIAAQVRAAQSSKREYPVISSRLIVCTPAMDFIAPRRLYETGMPVSEYLFCRRKFSDGAHAMQTSTLLVRRDMMLAIPFRSGLKRHQDWDWLLRAAQQPGADLQMIAEPLTIYRVEDPRPSVGRTIDWEFSLEWGREVRPYFTPRAYSFFVATECMARAVKSNAGSSVYLSLAWEFLTKGTPTVRSLVWLATFALVPHTLRSWARERLRRTKTKQQESFRETPKNISGQSSAAVALPDTMN